MFTFIHGDWHLWTGTRGYLLSDESKKKLRSFEAIDDAIDFLYYEAKDKPAARALNAAKAGSGLL